MVVLSCFHHHSDTGGLQVPNIPFPSVGSTTYIPAIVASITKRVCSQKEGYAKYMYMWFVRLWLHMCVYCPLLIMASESYVMPPSPHKLCISLKCDALMSLIALCHGEKYIAWTTAVCTV